MKKPQQNGDSFSLMSFEELKKIVEAGVIENCAPELINACSIDVTLGREILIERPSLEGRKLSLRDHDALATTRIQMEPEYGYTLRPGEFVLACSEQIFRIPNNIACEYKLKSSMARIGLNHALAGWCDPGWNGSVLTLELMNVTRHHSIVIRPGDRIGQMIFFNVRPVPPSASYEGKGRYNGDKSVSGAKP